MFNQNPSPEKIPEINIRDINSHYADVIQTNENNELFLNDDALAAIEQSDLIQLTAPKIIEIEKFLNDPKTPEALKAIFDQIKRNLAKKVGGIEEITYN